MKAQGRSRETTPHPDVPDFFAYGWNPGSLVGGTMFFIRM